MVISVIEAVPVTERILGQMLRDNGKNFACFPVIRILSVPYFFSVDRFDTCS